LCLLPQRRPPGPPDRRRSLPAFSAGQAFLFRRIPPAMNTGRVPPGAIRPLRRHVAGRLAGGVPLSFPSGACV